MGLPEPAAQGVLRFSPDQNDAPSLPTRDRGGNEKIRNNQVVLQGGDRGGWHAHRDHAIGKKRRPLARQGVDRPAGSGSTVRRAREHERQEQPLDEAMLPEQSQASLDDPKRHAREEQLVQVVAQENAVVADGGENGLVSLLEHQAASRLFWPHVSRGHGHGG